jgi:enoyl-CoA hydratase
LTGNYLSAEQAEAWGLVNRVVEPDQLLPACRALARDMLECPREMVVAYKRMIDVGFGLTYQQGRALEAAVSARQAEEVTAGAVGGRQEAVISRGRRQTED